MNNPVYTICDKCYQEIHYGEAYVSIARNVEQAKHMIAKNKDEVFIIDSLLLFTLCTTCGNAFNYNALTRIIETIPMKNSTYEKN